MIGIRTQALTVVSYTAMMPYVSCCRHGNLLALNEALQSNEQFFIRSGVYLILEKLKVITYRNLFKKV